MPYAPINVAAYTATYAGAISGMAVSGWIIDPVSAHYLNATIIAGAFAKAFDIAWNNAAQLNDLELACMTSVVQTDFRGRGPGPFESTVYKDFNNWNVAARACVALILQCDIFFASEGITPATGSNINVNRVMFVDATGAVAGANGTLGHPFPTIQQAIVAIEAAAWNDAIIMLAPGTYNAAHSIPASATLTDLVITGWAATLPLSFPADLPGIAGDFSVFQNLGDIAVHFSNLNISATIHSSNTVTQDLSVSFDTCKIGGAGILANNILASFVKSSVECPITGTTTTSIETDGFSWSTIVTQDITITPADYDRQFFDTGADTGPGPLTANGVAIGGTAICPVVYAGARPGEFAIACMSLPVAADYTVSFSHTDDDLVYFRLTNDSRVSTNFNEACRIVVFHSSMSAIPVP